MELTYFSVAVILGFMITRYITENTDFHIRNNKVWMHHWIIAFIALGVVVYFNIESPWISGSLLGVALEGLGRKNWSIKR